MGEPIIGPIADILPDPPRMDRDDTYVGVLVAIWFSGLGIYLLPIGTGALATVDGATQKLFAIAMMLGTGLALFGSVMGPGQLKITAPIRWVMRKLLKSHYTPTPLRHCYRLGGAGLWSTCMSLFAFSWILFAQGNIVGTFTGLISPILFIVWVRKGLRLLREARRMDRDYKRLVRQVRQQ